MKPIYKLGIFCLAFIVIVALIWVLLIGSIDFSENMPQPTEAISCSDMTQSKDFIPQDYNLATKSAFEQLIGYRNYLNVNCISQILVTLDSLDSNHKENRKLIRIYLTDSLNTSMEGAFGSLNIDSLIHLVAWIDDLDAYSKIDNENAKLFKITADFWFSRICNLMNDLYDKDYLIKYSYKFKYLTSRCAEHGYSSDVGLTDTEKLLDYTFGSRLGHVVDRVMTDTSLFQKILMCIVFCLTIYGTLNLCAKLFNLSKRKHF